MLLSAPNCIFCVIPYSSFVLVVNEKRGDDDTTFLLEFLKEKTPKTSLVKVRLRIVNYKQGKLSDDHVNRSLFKAIVDAYFHCSYLTLSPLLSFEQPALLLEILYFFFYKNTGLHCDIPVKTRCNEDVV